MEILYTILKAAVAIVLVASLLEALVLTARSGIAGYDWKAAGVSVLDFLVREYPLRFLLPLAFWTDAMGWFWQHRLWTLSMDHWSGWAACFIAQEFCYYWYHRAAHRVRWFWATHAVHHSPNELTLAAALRLGWTGKLTGTALFFAPLVWLGFPPLAVVATLAANLLYQFWLHAPWMPRLGPLEWVLNTPHAPQGAPRVQPRVPGPQLRRRADRVRPDVRHLHPERADTPCRFGLVRPMTGYNLLKIEFHQWQALWHDLRTARSFGDACGYLLKPPGWRPGGLGGEDLRRGGKRQESLELPDACHWHHR
jgi:hypothetical protein